MGLTEPKKAERSQWRGGCHSLDACGELRGGRAGHGVGLDQPTPSPSPFTASPEGLSPKASTIFRSLILDEDRDCSFGELLAASCEVQLLPFFSIFPFLEHQWKIDPGSRAGKSSAHSTYSSTFLCSSALVAPVEMLAKNSRKSPEFCFPGFAKTFLLIKQPKEMRRFSLALRVGSALNFKKGFANAILQNTPVPSPARLKYKF